MYVKSVSSKSSAHKPAQVRTSPVGGFWAQAGANVQHFGNLNLMPRLN